MESSATDPFTYQPLTEPDSIRLLLIQPATSHTTSIKCKLLHTTLSRCNHEIIDHYTALSYVWGNASHTKTINVDGRSVTVTATLEAAIRDLRDLNRPLHIWADALCIDQSNVDERNQQVRLMGKIYSTAHHTVIHLGALSPGARDLLDATLSNSNPYYGGEESRGVLQNIAELAEKDIISRPWFNRVWIFQELVLSRDPWVQCGILRARWTDFCSLVLSGPRVQGGGSKRIELLRSMNNMRAGQSGGGLLNMLLERRGLGATDPRDMVFAHMGIAADRNQWGDAVQVDYRKSCAQVYEDVARYLLSTVGPEKLFAQLDSVPLSTRQSGLASWSPDWSLPASYTVAMYKDNLLYTDQLDAKRYSVLAPEEHVLAYMGYVVDEIESVSLSVPPFSQMNAASRTEYQDTVQELKKLYARAGGSYWSGDEDGQHINISLRRHRDEHIGLCQKLLVEWKKILEEELSVPRGQQDYLSEVEGHKEFVASFKTWFEGQAMNPDGLIMVGNDSQGLLSLLDRHLVPTITESVLDNRRLATTKEGKAAVIPSQARDGDKIVYFAGSGVAMVVRKSPFAGSPALERQIMEKFEEKDDDLDVKRDSYVGSFRGLFGESKDSLPLPKRYCSLVGEAYVDGIVGWARGMQHEKSIFVLH